MSIARLTALCLSLIVAAALIGQFILNGKQPDLQNWGLRVWGLMRYFTILTCGLVGVLMTREAFGHRVAANWHATVTLSIIMVLLRKDEFVGVTCTA